MPDGEQYTKWLNANLDGDTSQDVQKPDAVKSYLKKSPKKCIQKLVDSFKTIDKKGKLSARDRLGKLIDLIYSLGICQLFNFESSLKPKFFSLAECHM